MNVKIIRKQNGESSLTVRAERISRGKKKTRVRFTDTDSSAFDVAAKTLSNSFSQRILASAAVSSKKYVAVNINNQKVLLNVNSVAHRLHLTKAEVIAASKTKNFSKILSKKAKLTEKVLNNYNEILNLHFSPSNKNASLKRSNGEATVLTKESIIKVIFIALQQDLGCGIEVEGGTKPTLAIHQEKGKVALIFIEKKIGMGGSANIFSIDDTKVYKMPKRIPKISQSTRKEFQINTKLNENGPHGGISLPMRLVECFHSDGDPGILMPQYDHDYDSICPTESYPLTSLSPEELSTIISEFELLLSGLAYMHSQGILHGDIKTDNILQKEGRTDIIDFGEARDIQNTQNLIPNGETSAYNYFNDIAMRNREKDLTKLIAIEKARDVFALGTTFFRRFEYNTPFKDMARFGYQEGTERNDLPDFVPKAISALIEGMTHPEIYQRLSADEALAQLRTCLKSSIG